MNPLAAGRLRFDGVSEEVGPELTRSAFERSPLARDASIGVENPPWISYRLIQRIEGQQLHVTLSFEDDALRYVRVSFYEGPRDWKVWSEQGELELKDRHDEWISAQLGELIVPQEDRRVPYPYTSWRFGWGELWSSYDPRSAGSSFGLNYE